jgi:hypothetical protein
MDVGSTKVDVVQAARNALGSQIASFVPAHPNTGKEVAGVEHADAEQKAGLFGILAEAQQAGAEQGEGKGCLADFRHGRGPLMLFLLCVVVQLRRFLSSGKYTVNAENRNQPEASSETSPPSALDQGLEKT